MDGDALGGPRQAGLPGASVWQESLSARTVASSSAPVAHAAGPAQDKPSSDGTDPGPGRDPVGRALDSLGLPDQALQRDVAAHLLEADLPVTRALVDRLAGAWPGLSAAERGVAVALAARGLLPTATLLALGTPGSAGTSDLRRRQALQLLADTSGTPDRASEGRASEGPDDLVSLLKSLLARWSPGEARLARLLREAPSEASKGSLVDEDSALPGGDQEVPSGWLHEAWSQGVDRMLDPAVPQWVPFSWAGWQGAWQWEREPDSGNGQGSPWRTVLDLEHPDLGGLVATLSGQDRTLGLTLAVADERLREEIADRAPALRTRIEAMGWSIRVWNLEAEATGDAG